MHSYGVQITSLYKIITAFCCVNFQDQDHCIFRFRVHIITPFRSLLHKLRNRIQTRTDLHLLHVSRDQYYKTYFVLVQ